LKERDGGDFRAWNYKSNASGGVVSRDPWTGLEDKEVY